MVSGATLGAIAGFFGALVVLGIPLLGFLLRLDRRVRRALSIVLGREDVDGDGLLARLRRVEEALAGADCVDYQTPTTTTNGGET